MDAEEIKPKTKQAGWKIPEQLRFLLNSHSAYLSAENNIETTTDEMVTLWLEERLEKEQEKRYRIGIERIEKKRAAKAVTGDT